MYNSKNFEKSIHKNYLKSEIKSLSPEEKE